MSSQAATTERRSLATRGDYRIVDLGALLRVSEDTIKRGIRSGRIPRPTGVAPGGRPWWSRDVIDRWIVEGAPAAS